MLIKILRQYLRPYRTPILLVLALQFVQTLCALYLPTLNADIIDSGVVKGDTGYVLRTGAFMLVFSLLQIACSIGAVYFGAKTATSLGRDLRAGIFDRVQAFSTREVGRFGAPSLLTRTTNDVLQVQMVVLMTFTMAAAAPVMLIGGVILALRQDVPLSGLLVAVIPALGIAISIIIARMGPLFRVVQVRIDKINGVMREQITGIRVIRAFVKDEHEYRRYGEANNELLDVSLRVGKLMALMFPIVMTIVNFASVGVLWFGAHRIDSGGMQIGSLTAFLNYLMQILMSVMMTTFMFMMVPRAAVCADRIGEVLETESSVVVPTTAKVPLTSGTLELRGASFKYPGAEDCVLNEVSLTALPGETTAIIGSTGAGKTTLLNLVPRLADVTDGAVLVDGVDVRELDPKTLTQSVAIVPQKPYLFTGTIASNLRYGRPDASDEELWEALDTAQARDFVERMPEGLNSPIAQGGTNVSGGQRQRLAIARALVHKPEIFLFDDSFSALDYSTDARLRAALVDQTRESTVVIVAQRVSTIRNADRIIVLDLGVVVGSGTHSELMESNQTYREIVLSQLTEEEAAA
ncbi:ABC transporter ATP-binding protein [Catenulispora sp. NF23]|uniref:ABC transporter ATP-binding protein n=1 Tax=Catenulispora pinistramenti TaxID=2705254 RepID=A0ABS5KWF6_9ACTN|nr:ABC transporter ATP-binding protein [Catenulispora pinistramenti]MBS2535893.1 ABC transporter ATP-binding protein [Catenulispora pinistramenti]MBS2550400.1 ABC transporter ATP-binding protein [Catenulispora pinistramenti]